MNVVTAYNTYTFLGGEIGRLLIPLVDKTNTVYAIVQDILFCSTVWMNQYVPKHRTQQNAYHLPTHFSLFSIINLTDVNVTCQYFIFGILFLYHKESVE